MDDVLYSAATDRDGNLYLFAHVATMPGTFPTTRRSCPPNARPTRTTSAWCASERRPASRSGTSTSRDSASVKRWACRRAAPSTSECSRAPRTTAASRSSSMIQSDLSGMPATIGGLNNGPIGTIPGRPTNIIDIEATGGGDVYVLHEQLVNADSELQGRLVRFDAQGVMGPAVEHRSRRIDLLRGAGAGRRGKGLRRRCDDIARHHPGRLPARAAHRGRLHGRLPRPRRSRDDGDRLRDVPRRHRLRCRARRGRRRGRQRLRLRDVDVG